MEVNEIMDYGTLILQVIVSGITCYGVITLFGLGIGAAIDLLKLFGGVR